MMSEHTRAGSIAAKGGSVLAAAQGSGLSSALFSRFSSVLLASLQMKTEMRTALFSFSLLSLSVVHSMSRSSLTAAAAMAAIWRRTVWARGKGGAQRTFSWARYQELLQAGGAPPVPRRKHRTPSAALPGRLTSACETHACETRGGLRVAAILPCRSTPAAEGCG